MLDSPLRTPTTSFNYLLDIRLLYCGSYRGVAFRLLLVVDYCSREWKTLSFSTRPQLYQLLDSIAQTTTLAQV